MSIGSSAPFIAPGSGLAPLLLLGVVVAVEEPAPEAVLLLVLLVVCVLLPGLRLGLVFVVEEASAAVRSLKPPSACGVHILESNSA